MELAHIAANKNTVPGDVSAMVPGGIRMGEFACISVVRAACSSATFNNG